MLLARIFLKNSLFLIQPAKLSQKANKKKPRSYSQVSERNGLLNIV